MYSDYTVEYSSDCFLESIMNCYEDLTYFDFITEKSKTSLIEKIKAFFMDLRITVENLITEIKLKYLSNKRKKEFKKLVKDYYNSARTNKDNNIRKTIEMIDLWKYKELYLEMNRELWKYAEKFSKVEYKHLDEIDADMRQFDSIVNKYAKQLERVLSGKITVPVEKVIRFYEDETTHNSDAIKTLQENMDRFQKMEADAINLEKRVNKYGAEILPKQMNFIRKMMVRINSAICKAIVKFMTILIVIF